MSLPSEPISIRTSGAAVAVLAAGAGSRFGGAKLVQPLAGRPVVAWAADAALGSGLGPVLVVTGFHSQQVRQALPMHSNIEVLTNPAPEKGMAGSLALAAGRAREMGASALVIILGDMPFVKSQAIAQVAAAALDSSHGAAAAEASGRPGHPVAFTSSWFEKLTQLSGDKGARDILKRLGPDLALVSGIDSAALDIDTPDDLKAAEDLLSSTKPE